jgi:mono/diheme cytochrome c family protein
LPNVEDLLMLRAPSSPTSIVAASLLAGALAAGLAADARAVAGETQRSARPGGWQIPPEAAAEKNPVEASEAVLARGKQIYEAKCQRCHGPEGQGDGPDADPDQMPGDLSDGSRAPQNPDGVMFYKIWNGRSRPKMPAYSTELSREEVWTLIHYVKTLRK